MDFCPEGAERASPRAGAAISSPGKSTAVFKISSCRNIKFIIMIPREPHPSLIWTEYAFRE